MLYRTLGETGLRVSILGFGASPLGGVFGPVEQTQANRAVRAALDAGINFLDVAPFYGATRAETVLGRALSGVPREQYLLATKVGRYGQDEFDFSARRVTKSVEESLERLGVDTLDLVHCHDIEFGSLAQVAEETLPALERLRSQGKVRFLGISGYPLRIFSTMLERLAADVRLDVVLSYCHFYPGNDLLTGLLPTLQRQGVGVISASPLGMGLLRDAPPPDWHPAPPELRADCATAAAHCRSRGANLADLALHYALAEERIATTLVGITCEEEVRRNVAAVGVPPDPTLLAEVLEILNPVRNLEWPSGRPENR